MPDVLWFANPKGIASSSPRLPSLRGYLGSRCKNGFNRNAAVANVARDGRTGMAATALRLKILAGRIPSVARASQPWALGRNPVGILGWLRRHKIMCNSLAWQNQIVFGRNQSQRDCDLQPKVGAPAPTLGSRSEMETTSTRLWPLVRRWKQNGRNRVAVGNFLRTLTQG